MKRYPTRSDFKRFRQWIAYKIAPWTYVPYREEREEAFRDLAQIAYGNREAIWTSPRTLVDSALRQDRTWVALQLMAVDFAPTLGIRDPNTLMGEYRNRASR